MMSRSAMRDTAWGIAVAAPLSELRLATQPYVADLPPTSFQFFSGREGMVALLFSEDDADESLAHDLAHTLGGPVYLFDFNEHAPRTRVYDRTGTPREIGDHPAKILKQHGVIAPGY